MTQTPEERAPGAIQELALLRKNLGRALGLAFAVDRGLSLAYLALGLVDALLPVAIAAIGKEIVDGVVDAARHDVGVEVPLLWVGIEAILVGARVASGQGIGYVAELLRGKVSMHVQRLIAEKGARLSLQHFEDPEIMNLLERARRDAPWRPVEMLTHGVTLARNLVTLAGFAVLLSTWTPWAMLAMLVSGLPIYAEARWSRRDYERRLARTADERKAGYYQQALTSDQIVKEVKLFGLAPFFLSRWQRIQDRFLGEDARFARGRGLAITGLTLLSTAVFYGVLVWLVALAAAGALTLGAMTMYMAVLRQAQTGFHAAMGAVARAWGDSLYLRSLFAYLGLPDDDVATRGPGDDAPDTAAPSLVFEGVAFRYPGSERNALRGVDFEVAPGETVALVGANGAGKTTLIKLLTGLYRADEGRVLLGGQDVKDMDPGALRARLGVVFQDFAHYHLTAAENVGVGWLPSLDDRDAVQEAAQRGGARELLESLPAGLDTQLGRWFGGEQLSIGQWQRVALARAFMRKSELMVLDEPTASLDAEGELEIFQRFRELARGRSVLLVTHRFSTVRMADRIVVLADGRVAEQGTHRELLALGGLYARMFRAQAEGYAEAPAEV